ncbi:TetR family transcriptional regulator [Dokdonia pacifica]|uniref:Transcriptional regulator, TetR family n=1 Tax=Dokdonia pacifica TaxID=1627892 RepID=A0A238WIW2_9FLAO|nr:TetR/AcrR family transcriptional regulator [Dokdonia pacifica]GGG21562.1 TetR family transcriptional regulator [Dokdonia pacifica]SNR46495.1 transcriptional regulator, TetR family [Dokdonia pacifica]
MRNPEATKELIILKSADLFNTQGYKATSLSDITKATGFTKGAIYRHFENKEDLERQALHSLSKRMFKEISTSIKAATNFQEKMEAIFIFFEGYMETPLYQGGCPLLNAAIESDDANPIIKEQALVMLSRLKESMHILFQNGIKNNQIKSTIAIDYYITIFIAILEGGIMMSRLENNKTAITHAINHLRNLVKEIVI